MGIGVKIDHLTFFLKHDIHDTFICVYISALHPGKARVCHLWEFFCFNLDKPQLSSFRLDARVHLQQIDLVGLLGVRYHVDEVTQLDELVFEILLRERWD